MMNKYPTLSVIVPVYKAEKTIERCVNSILSQTLSDLELILVEDGSPDNSGEICEKLAKKDGRIHVFHQENGGAASARNLGIDNAKGLYIGFVDSDDYIDPDMYERLILVLEENDLPYIDSQRITVRDNCFSEHTNTDALKTISGEEAIGHLLDWTGSCSLCTRLFRADVFRGGFRLPVGKRVEDFIFCIRLFDKFGTETCFDHAYYYVVSHEGSVTKSGGGSIFLDALFYADETEKLVEEKYPQLREKQDFFRFYCIGQLFINSRSNEYDKHLDQYKHYFSFLRRNLGKALKNHYLSNSYKLLLLISCINYRLPAKLHKKRELKNGK